MGFESPETPWAHDDEGERGTSAPAFQHLTEAKRIAWQFGPTPMRAKIDAALAERWAG